MKVTFLIISVLLSAHVLSQQDPQAGNILQKVAERINKTGYISLRFEYNFYDSQRGDSFTYNGTMVIKGNKYKMDAVDNVVYFDGETLWNYLPEVNEVNISEPMEEDDDFFFLTNPLGLFSVYEEEYKYRYNGEINVNGSQSHSIDLFPFDLNKPFHTIRITIDKQRLQLNGIKILGKGGDTHDIELSDFSPNEKIDDGYFRFKVTDYPDIEVIDLRF